MKMPMGRFAAAVSVIWNAICSRRVARGVQDVHLDVAHHEEVAVAYQHHAWIVGVAVLPLGVAHIAENNRGAGNRRQFTTATHKVGMDVCFGDVGDAQPFLLGGTQVRRDIAHGVDDQGLAGLGTTDQVRCLRQLFVVEVFE